MNEFTGTQNIRVTIHIRAAPTTFRTQADNSNVIGTRKSHYFIVKQQFACKSYANRRFIYISFNREDK